MFVLIKHVFKEGEGALFSVLNQYPNITPAVFTLKSLTTQCIAKMGKHLKSNIKKQTNKTLDGASRMAAI